MDYDRVEVGPPYNLTPYTVQRVATVGEMPREQPNLTSLSNMPWKEVLCKLRAARIRLLVLRQPSYIAEVLDHTPLPDQISWFSFQSDLTSLSISDLAGKGYKVTFSDGHIHAIRTVTCTSGVLPKVLWLTRTEWALGAISQAVSRLPLDVDLRVLGWEQEWRWWEHVQRGEYALLMVQTLAVYSDVVNLAGGRTVIPVCHGPVELEPEWYESRGGLGKLNPGMLIGGVSKALVSDLCDLGFKGMHTPCGVDTTLYAPGPREAKAELRVLYPRPYDENDCHRQTKRFDLVCRLQQEFSTHESIQLRFVPAYVSLTDMVRVYQETDIVLVLSKSEGNPLPVLEGGACGCTVVTTRVGIVPELIDCSNGVIVDGSTDEELFSSVVSALQYLSSNRAVLALLQRSLCARVTSDWSWDKHTGAWNSFLTDALPSESVEHQNMKV
jgi:glycosyltransferase involved in cell wall biosynthesis